MTDSDLASSSRSVVPAPLDGVFIGWHGPAGRAPQAATALGLEFHPILISGKDKVWRAPDRYARAALATLRLLRRRRPSLVIVTNPPIFCPLVAYGARKLGWCDRVVIDSHTGAFLDPRWARFVPVHRWLSRRVDLTVVHNAHQEAIVEGWGVPSMTVGYVPIERPEPGPVEPPNRAEHGSATDRGGRYVLAACSGGYDEPLNEIAAAARALPEVEFRVTGRAERIRNRLTDPAPPNLRLLGFVPTEEFFRQMAGAAVVLALTTREATLLSAGFEAVAFGRPLVTSDTAILREYFNRGTVTSDHSATGLAGAISHAMADGERLSEEMDELRDREERTWAEFVEALLGRRRTS